MRETLLQHLACHLLTLADWAARGQAGPVASASEGSVSAGFAVPRISGESYFLQTPCGRTYWQMSLPWRLGGRYHPLKPYHPWG
jgi:hypothetical protein